MDFTKKELHFHIYYLGLCLLLISLPTSRFMITISLFILAVNWLAEGNFSEKFLKIKCNKPILAFTGIYMVHLVGFIWTKDASFAVENDLLHKLPTLLLPWIFVSSPIPDAKKIRLLLFLFIASVLSASVIGIGMSLYRPVNDFRETSPFISNIYFSLMLILATFQLPLLIRQVSNNQFMIGLGFTIAAWFIFFIVYSRSASGIAALSGVLIFTFLLIVALNKSRLIKVIFLVITGILMGTGIWLLDFLYDKSARKAETDFGLLEEYTSCGNPYTHDTLNILRENGHLVYLYISEEELEKAWNERSHLDFQGTDMGSHSLKHTLYRYMASKGLKKDREGIKALTDDDIRAIEHGTTNYYYLRWPGLLIRLHQMMRGLYIYRETGYKNPVWSTLTERLDLWRAAIIAIKEYPMFGWGTGSILKAMDYGIEVIDSPLRGRNMKPHNQYLYTILSVGFTGFIIVLLLFSYFVIKTRLHVSFIFLVLLISFLINLIANNSLESQLGQNFFVPFTLIYAYFYPQLNTEKKFVY